MFALRWRKVWRDLWRDRRRSLLVVLSIAIGVFAVGTVTHMQVVVSRDMADSYRATNPASATLYTAGSFDEDLLRVVQQMPEVAEAEGRRSMVVRFRLNQESDWYAMQLSAASDYDDMRVDIVHPELHYDPDPALWPAPAVWPVPDHEILLERTSLLVPYLGLWPTAEQGDAIQVETPRGWQREVRLAGLVYDFSRIPATNMGMAYGYVTFETLEWLGEERGFNELHILVEGDRDDVEHIKRVASRVKDRLERGGVTVLRTEVPEPGRLPLDYQFRAIVLILGILGISALALGGALVANTISALLAQQVRQIGMMKAVGGHLGQIGSLYLGMVLLLGALGVFIAAPLSALAAREFIGFMAYFINFVTTQPNSALSTCQNRTNQRQ